MGVELSIILFMHSAVPSNYLGNFAC